MHMKKILFGVVAIAVFLGSPLAALAADGPPPPRPGQEFCKDNPGKCEEARAKRAERREFCKANPEKCKEQREQLQAKRAELQAKCQADPAKCTEMKDQARKKFQGKMAAPPPPPRPAK